MRRSANIAASAIAGLFASLVVGVGVAHATPTGCSTGYVGTGDGSYAYCTGGTGTYRATVQCRQQGMPNTYFAYGSWLSPGGQTSVALCTSGDLASQAGIQYR